MPGKRLVAVAGLIGVLLLVAPTAGAFASPGAAPAAPAACTELAKNGNFESGSANWTQEGGSGVQLIDQLHPRTGQYSAHFGGMNDANHRIKQQIVVPANQIVTLSFWWEQWTQETAPGTQDYLAVNVLDSSGALLKQLTQLGVDPDAILGEWEQLTFGLTGYAGKTVQLQFQAVTDMTNPSNFFVDDVSVRICTAKHMYLPLIRR